MLGAIKYGLGNLLNFTGRDARQTFWYFVLAIYVGSIALTMVVMVPVMAQLFSGAFRAAQSGLNPAETDAAMMSQMSGMFGSIGWVGMVSGVVLIVVLAASFVRRLHDSNLSGWWAAIPGALYAYAISQMPAQMAAMSTMLNNPQGLDSSNPFGMMQAQGSMAVLSWIPIIIVVALGVRKSNDGPNRFGTEPVRF